MELSVSINGDDVLAAALESASGKIRGIAGGAVRKTGQDIESTAKANAPVDTGNLRNSITTDVSEGGRSIEVRVGPTAEYGVYVNCGTYKMPPQSIP